MNPFRSAGCLFISVCLSNSSEWSPSERKKTEIFLLKKTHPPECQKKKEACHFFLLFISQRMWYFFQNVCITDVGTFFLAKNWGLSFWGVRFQWGGGAIEITIILGCPSFERGGEVI